MQEDILTKRGVEGHEGAQKLCSFLAKGDEEKYNMLISLFELGVAEGVSRASKMLDKMIEEKMNRVKQ